MNIERRKVLKSIGAPFLLTLAAAGGLLKQRVSFSAALNKSLFESRDPKDVLSGLIGRGRKLRIIPNRKINLALAEIIENTHAIPVEVTSNIENTTRITLICEQLDFPLLADFMLSNGAQGYINTRFKLGSSSCRIVNVRALVHTADGEVYSAVTEGYVSVADCDGGM